jgi:hypothetical protein
MTRLARVLLTFAATSLTLFALAITPNLALADDPTLTDPTLQTSGSTSTDPTYADPDWWWNCCIPMLEMMYPDATYDELCALALLYFNVYPPL